MEPRGIRNNNPLNIRKGNNWKGERHPQTDPAFEEFETMVMGIRAGFKLLRNYITGYSGKVKPINTIHKIVHRWAPMTENATDRYIDFVSKDTGIAPHAVIRYEDRKSMVAIVDAMIFVECGQRVSRDVIQSAYDLV